jgi:FixJ family two-component response regulator
MCLAMTHAIIQCSTPARKLSKIPVASIIDDDKDVREATEALIQTFGYDTTTFASAEDYLRSGYAGVTSCLIRDVHMSGISGVDLQDRLLADGHSIPIIFMTGVVDEKTRARALKAGGVGFLTKPFDVKDLIACLDKALKGSR